MLVFLKVFFPSNYYLKITKKSLIKVMFKNFRVKEGLDCDLKSFIDGIKLKKKKALCLISFNCKYTLDWTYRNCMSIKYFLAIRFTIFGDENVDDGVSVSSSFQRHYSVWSPSNAKLVWKPTHFRNSWDHFRFVKP